VDALPEPYNLPYANTVLLPLGLVVSWDPFVQVERFAYLV